MDEVVVSTEVDVKALLAADPESRLKLRIITLERLLEEERKKGCVHCNVRTEENDIVKGNDGNLN